MHASGPGAGSILKDLVDSELLQLQPRGLKQAAGTSNYCISLPSVSLFLFWLQQLAVCCLVKVFLLCSTVKAMMQKRL